MDECPIFRIPFPHFRSLSVSFVQIQVTALTDGKMEHLSTSTTLTVAAATADGAIKTSTLIFGLTHAIIQSTDGVTCGCTGLNP